MLNYSTHAIEDILSQAKQIKNANSNPDVAEMRLFADALRAGEKFMLPDRGALIYDPAAVPEGLEITRLPYPDIVIEVPFSQDNVSPGMILSSKRVILASEIIFDYATGEARPSTRVEVPNAIRVDVACWLDQFRKWTLQSTGVVVRLGEKSSSFVKPEDDPYSHNRLGDVSFTMAVIPRLPRLAEQMRSQLGESAFAHTVSNDVGSEVRILAEMLAVLSCRNVSLEKEAPPAKLNKARSRSGREPFYEAHVLVVGDARLSGGGGERASDGEFKVRQHLRRGHIRRLETGVRIWVNQTVVAAGSQRGDSAKTYQIKAASRAN